MMNDSSHNSDHLIEKTLEQRPLAPLPPGFINRVMAQIQAAEGQVTREAIRYKLELLDVALPVLGTCLVVLALGLSGRLDFLGIAAPVTWSPVLPITGLPALTQWVSSNWLALIGLFVIAEICLAALFCTWWWLDQPLSLVDIRET
jgi:hypothetical protein